MTKIQPKPTKVGRPSRYSDALAQKICELIEQGYSERKIAEMEGMPHVSTINRWKSDNPEFCEQSARARAISAELFREEALQVARDTAALADRVAECLNGGEGEMAVIPKGFVDAKKLLVQELNREAAIRDDSRYGDRKTVAVEAATGQGLKDFYDSILKDLKEADG